MYTQHKYTRLDRTSFCEISILRNFCVIKKRTPNIYIYKIKNKTTMKSIHLLIQFRNFY